MRVRTCWLFTCFIASALFLDAQWYGGRTWDEYGHYIGTKQQIEMAQRVISGAGDKDFRTIDSDLAFYGIGTLLPAYAVSSSIENFWGEPRSAEAVYSAITHLIAFLSAIVAALCVGRLVRLATGDQETSVWAATSLMLMPPWLGYAFFNYKDVPVATGVIGCVCYAALYWKRPDWRTSTAFFAALLWLGSQKLAALPLAVPAAMYIGIAALRAGRWQSVTLGGQALVFLGLLYIITPPAWIEPIEFFRTNLAYMSQHGWRHCTLTAGECLGRGTNSHPRFYSPLRYIGLWYAIQTPLAIIVLLAAAVAMYLHRRGESLGHLVAASLTLPVVAMTWRQSTLYDGIRHTLFLLPLIVVFIFINIKVSDWRPIRPWFAGYLTFLLVDAITLQPYSYIWRNELARFWADDSVYEADYWGFSMHEATHKARPFISSDTYVVGQPPHLVSIDKPSGILIDKAASVPKGAQYISIAVARLGLFTPESNCEPLDAVIRSQFPFVTSITLSRISRCGGSKDARLTSFEQAASPRQGP